MASRLKAVIGLALISLTLFSCKNDNPVPGNNSNVQPLSAFSYTGDQHINSEITFLNKSKNATGYKWDFGNGQTSDKETPPKVKYTAEGVYDVILTAINGNKRAVYKQTLLIAPDDNPKAHFSYAFKDQSTKTPAVVQFTNESVNGVTFKWLIDGQTSYEHDPKHTFNQAGAYTVSLTAIHGAQQHTYTDVVTVTANSDPQAGFVLAYHPYPYKVNEPIQFVNQSKNADAWEWTFGNNGPAPSTAEHPEVTFTTAGNYAVTLIAKKGTVKSAPKTITIKINP